MLKLFSKRKIADSSVNNLNQENKELPKFSSSADLTKSEETEGLIPSSHDRVSLTDADYEFLFDQLLDGVAHGWNQLKIIKFFQNLGTRGEESHWVAWLEKFSTKIPDVTNDSQRRLGAIMLRLAEVTQSAAELSQLSAISSQMGKKLFFGNIKNLIWEYDGLDVVSPATSITDNLAGKHEDNSLEENISSVSEPISESMIANSAELEDIESSQSEEAIIPPDSAIANSSELEEKEHSATTNQLETKELESHSIIELVESWFNLGLKQANAGDLSGAIESWRKALEINPNLAEIWHNLGSALGRLEHYPEAIESFNHALQIDPQSHQAWNDRAHAFSQMEQWEEAIASWQKAISLKPENHQFWYHHGCALEAVQHLDKALVSYAKALEISPNFQPARSKYANLITKS